MTGEFNGIEDTDVGRAIDVTGDHEMWLLVKVKTSAVRHQDLRSLAERILRRLGISLGYKRVDVWMVDPPEMEHDEYGVKIEDPRRGT